VHPVNSLYFNGAVIIKALKLKGSLTFMELFLEIKAIRDMPISLFVLSLDWLYLASVVHYNDNEKIELCS